MSKAPATQPSSIDVPKILSKLNDNSNKLSITINKIEQNLVEKLSSLETTISTTSNNFTTQTLSEIKQELNTNYLLLKELNVLVNTNTINFNQLLGNLEQFSNTSSLDTEAIETLEALNENMTSLLTANSQVIEKLDPLQNYLITIVKALTTLYERNNELKSMQTESISKLDNITKILTSLTEEENKAQTIVNTQVKPTITNKIKALFAPLFRLKTNQNSPNTP